LQNIPTRGDLGREIRKGFIAPRGRRLLSCDYSQIELRILAHLSEDKNLQDAFFKERDIHTRTAASVFGMPEKDITREMRRRAKIINFGIIYGMSPYGLAQELNCTPEEGSLIISSYFETYPGVKDWIDTIVEKAEKEGRTETLLGRKRKIPELASSNFNTREFGKRVAINTPVQGSAADIIKKAMIRIDERLKSESVDAVMLLQIHDELLFEVKQNAVDHATAIIVGEMEHVVKLSVPLVVDVGVGKNWFEAH
jgi:DNA polymerase-1